MLMKQKNARNLAKTLVLACVLSMGLVACGSDNSSTPANTVVPTPAYNATNPYGTQIGPNGQPIPTTGYSGQPGYPGYTGYQVPQNYYGIQNQPFYAYSPAGVQYQYQWVNYGGAPSIYGYGNAPALNYNSGYIYAGAGYRFGW